MINSRSFTKALFSYREKVEISPYLQKLIDEVREDMSGFDEAHKKRITFLTTNSMKPWSCGATYLKRAYIALPDYFNATDVTQLKADILNQLLESDLIWKVPNQKMWFEGPGKLLISSFILSDKAKKFLIAREMGKNSITLKYNKAMYIASAVYGYYLVEKTFELSAKMKLSHMNPLRRILYACGALAVTVLFYISLNVLGYEYALERNGDAFAVSFGLKNQSEMWDDIENDYPRMLDLDYWEGAIEYYNKMIDRNVALHQMILFDRTNFSSRYIAFTKEGDDQGSVIKPSIKNTDRLDMIKKFKNGIPTRRDRLREQLHLDVPPTLEDVQRAQLEQDQLLSQIKYKPPQTPRE